MKMRLMHGSDDTEESDIEGESDAGYCTNNI